MRTDTINFPLQHDSPQTSATHWRWAATALMLARFSRHFGILVPWLVLALGSDMVAQTPGARGAPRIAYAYPAGAQQGTTVTVAVGGQNLAGAKAAYFSGAGVSAVIRGYERPLSQNEINDLREKLQKLQERKNAARKAAADAPPGERFTAADEKELEAVRAKLALRPARATTPALAETVTLEVTIAPDAEPGRRELRLRTPAGSTSPVVFMVDFVPETTATVVTATSPIVAPVRGKQQPVNARRPDAPHPMVAGVGIPAVINGQIMPGEVDRIRFEAQRGQAVSVTVIARELMPYLADAVPGWFQAATAIYDREGRELAYADDHWFRPDPALQWRAPADGTYTLEIKDALYRGREDFVYRVKLDAAPPPARGPEQVAGGRRHGIDSPHTLTPPVTAESSIATPGEEDVYAFEGKAGQRIVAEIFARRAGSPLDSRLELLTPDRRPMALNDDHEDRAQGRLTHHADSRLESELPADGTYLLRVCDAQGSGSPAHSYRLRLAGPQPDFELRVVPSTINVRAGGTTVLTAYAIRRDGFSGAIDLRLNGARGFTLGGAQIPAGADQVRFTLTAPGAASPEPLVITMSGSAKIGDRQVLRKAVPAEDMMQAFAYRHLVPMQTMIVDVSGRAPALRVDEPTFVHLSPGQTSQVRIRAARMAPDMVLALSDPPEGLTLARCESGGGHIDAFVTLSPEAKIPLRGNLIFVATVARKSDSKAPPAKANARTPSAILPAVPYEVARR